MGVGTSNPISKLNIASSLSATGDTFVSLDPFSAATNSTRIAWSRGDSWTPAAIGQLYSAGQNYGGALAFYAHADDGIGGNQASPIERVRILANGNVGIGTTNPTQTLAVNGAIRAKEVVVDTGWSDYVFADDYRLMPLREIERYIKLESHLPGIPSATEVAKDGISVGEMQAELLAKIEEITLYQIFPEKRLNKLEEENATLRASR